MILKISGAEAEQLPEPSANPAVMQHGGEEDAEGPLTQKLRRAWDLILRALTDPSRATSMEATMLH